MYTDIVMDHFSNPRNVGILADADGIGKEGNPLCGDVMEMFIKVEDGRIADIRFRTFGCGAAIATSSVATEMAKGMTLEEAIQMTRAEIASALGGLPAPKMHCSNLAADALRKAIRDYYEKHPEAKPDHIDLDELSASEEEHEHGHGHEGEG
jgi:nitrogen fixation protein NifU and related proteins